MDGVRNLRRFPNLKGLTVKTTACSMLTLAVTLLTTGSASAWHHCKHGYAAPMTGYAMPMTPMMGFSMPMSFSAPMVPFTPALSSGASMNFQMSMSGDASVLSLAPLLLRGVERFLGAGGGSTGLVEALLPQV